MVYSGRPAPRTVPYRRIRRWRRPRGRIARDRDPRAAGGAVEGEMGGEAAIHGMGGPPFLFSKVAPRERSERLFFEGEDQRRLAVEYLLYRGRWSGYLQAHT